MSNGTGPSQVLIIRHGEKLGDSSSNDASGGPNLSIRGCSRAAALPALFVPATAALACAVAASSGTSYTGTYAQVGLPGAPPRFPTPDFLFATQASSSSNRPVETITPLSVALPLEIDAKHSDKDFGKVATDILTHPKYAGKVVLVCWHHGKIQDLAQALGVVDPPEWPGSVFDRVWQIRFTSSPPVLEDLPQMLLHGDSSG